MRKSHIERLVGAISKIAKDTYCCDKIRYRSISSAAVIDNQRAIVRMVLVDDLVYLIPVMSGKKIKYVEWGYFSYKTLKYRGRFEELMHKTKDNELAKELSEFNFVPTSEKYLHCGVGFIVDPDGVRVYEQLYPLYYKYLRNEKENM